MKKLIFACLFLIFATQLYAQTPSKEILDIEKDLINDLSFAPAESNRSLNNGQMIELTECVFHGQALPGSKPKTRVLRYTLWYYGGVSGHGQPFGGRRVTYELDTRQDLRVVYQNNSLVITCSTVNGRVTEGSNVQSLKVITIPDVTTNRIYSGKVFMLSARLAALKIQTDRFYK